MQIFHGINYSNKDVLSKSAGYIGLAYQVKDTITVGLGYGSIKTTYYKWGYGVTGAKFRTYTTEEDFETGAVFLVEAGDPRGLGIQLIAGTSSVGLGLSVRY